MHLGCRDRFVYLDTYMNHCGILQKCSKTAIFVVLEDPYIDPRIRIKLFYLTNGVIFTKFRNFNDDLLLITIPDKYVLLYEFWV